MFIFSSLYDKLELFIYNWNLVLLACKNISVQRGSILVLFIFFKLCIHYNSFLRFAPSVAHTHCRWIFISLLLFSHWKITIARSWILLIIYLSYFFITASETSRPSYMLRSLWMIYKRELCLKHIYKIHLVAMVSLGWTFPAFLVVYWRLRTILFSKIIPLSRERRRVLVWRYIERWKQRDSWGCNRITRLMQNGIRWNIVKIQSHGCLPLQPSGRWSWGLALPKHVHTILHHVFQNQRLSKIKREEDR